MDTNLKPFFSIAIPCWDIKGKGVEYLEHSFNILAQQTFTDFNIIISDHSLDDSIENLCKDWSTLLNIKYIKNDIGRGNIAPNLNVAINNSDGKYIKILFQDDFLYDVDSLEKIYTAIQKDLEKSWIITACTHTKDCINLYDTMVPYYHDNIHEGSNTISCPTVLTIKNDNPLLFDESLNWLVDVEYYKRLYNTYGDPVIVNEVCAVNRDAEVRTTNLISEAQKQEETARVAEMYNQVLDLSRVTLIAVTSVRLEDHVRALKYSAKNIKFGAIKIVSDIEPKNLPPYIKHEYIDKISNIDEWNYAMIYKLGQYVDTEFAMIVHDDGFIINPQSWRPEFFDYDYIGAPWPLPYDDYSYRDINGELIRVGNSVSLRSKKLIDLPNVLNMEWKSFHGLYSEDGFICVNNRHIYKEHGCKFADIDVAKYFSHETPLPETQGIAPFAFHGKNSLPYQKIMGKLIKTDALLVISDYNWLPEDIENSWVTKYTDNYLILDRYHRLPQSTKVKWQDNVGQNVYDIFDFIYRNYENLPEIAIFCRAAFLNPKDDGIVRYDENGRRLSTGNCSIETFNKICNNTEFTEIHDFGQESHDRHAGQPIPASKLDSDGFGFLELNTSWYLYSHRPKFFNSLNHLFQEIFEDPIYPEYVRFSPGANYLIPKKDMLKYNKYFYQKMREYIGWDILTGEAHLFERAIYTLFTSNFKIKAKYKN